MWYTALAHLWMLPSLFRRGRRVRTPAPAIGTLTTHPLALGVLMKSIKDSRPLIPSPMSSTTDRSVLRALSGGRLWITRRRTF